MHEMLASLIQWYLAALDQGGYWLIGLLMAMESSILPVPSEFVIPPAAYLAHSKGTFTLTGIVIAGTVGSWVGASVMYWASYLIGRPLLMKYGRYVMITPEKIQQAEAWSSHYGMVGVFISRLLPVIRHLIGIPAGVVRMHFGWYSLATIIGSGLWCAVLCWVGVTAGQDEQLMQGNLHRITPVGGRPARCSWARCTIFSCTGTCAGDARQPMTAADSPPAGTNTVSPSAGNPLPAQKRDPATGRAVIDYRAVATLALPLMLNSSLQAVISLTDTWFVGHISTTAMAGMAAVYWVVLLFLMLVGGVGLAVQTFVAQAEGGRRFTRASHATWVALTASALTLPFFALLAWSGPLLFAPFGLAPDVSAQAMAFWQPRMLGAPLGVALWAVLGFFNGISRPRIAVMTTGLVAVVNAALNWLFIFELDGGIAGSAWATNVSMVCGLGLALWVFLGSGTAHEVQVAPDVAPRPGAASRGSIDWACRWARCTPPTCSAWRCSS